MIYDIWGWRILYVGLYILVQLRKKTPVVADGDNLANKHIL